MSGKERESNKEMLTFLFFSSLSLLLSPFHVHPIVSSFKWDTGFSFMFSSILPSFFDATPFTLFSPHGSREFFPFLVLSILGFLFLVLSCLSSFLGTSIFCTKKQCYEPLCLGFVASSPSYFHSLFPSSR